MKTFSSTSTSKLQNKNIGIDDLWGFKLGLVDAPPVPSCSTGSGTFGRDKPEKIPLKALLIIHWRNQEIIFNWRWQIFDIFQTSKSLQSRSELQRVREQLKSQISFKTRKQSYSLLFLYENV